MLKKLAIIGIVLLVSIASHGQNTADQDYAWVHSDDISGAVFGRWYTECTTDGCMMLTNMVIGDPAHPAGDSDHPDFITLSVFINRSNRKPKGMIIMVPVRADHDYGVDMIFSNDLSSSRPQYHFHYDSCKDEHCTVIIPEAEVAPTKSNPTGDLLSLFLKKKETVLIAFAPPILVARPVRKGELSTVSFLPLGSFQAVYARLMKTELKPQ